MHTGAQRPVLGGLSISSFATGAGLLGLLSLFDFQISAAGSSSSRGPRDKAARPM